MALIAFRRGRDQAGRWKDGRLQEEPQAAPLPGAADPADPGAEARSFYESLIADGEGAERVPGEGAERPSSPQFCRSCGSEFRDPPARHRRSTAHLLGLGVPPAPPEPLIPPSNRGYRLLLRGGWRGGGLGRGERGRTGPVPTELKRDRGGLGWRRARPRVTHFGPGDVTAVAGPPARRGRGAAGGAGRGERGSRGSRGRFRSEAAERAWEIRLREYMERWDPPEPPPPRASRRETPETP